MLCKYLLLFSAFLYVNNAFPQSSQWNDAEHGISIAKMEFKAKRVIPPAPEAAELGKYGNTQISLFTGTPKINIPLFELKGNSVSVPVSMSYNAGGFKPNEMASWVGLGWSLNAGGVITRSVLGNPDNANNYFNAQNTYTSPAPVALNFTLYENLTKMQNGQWETQPDVYFYNFGGSSGKFFISQDGSIIKKEKNNLKISLCSGCLPDQFSNFTIVDEQGNTYFFNTVELSTTTTDDAVTEGQSSPITYTYASSWYLSSITSADGTEIIQFSYHSPANEHILLREYQQSASQTYSLKTPPGGTITGSSNSIGISPMVKVFRKYLETATLYKNGAAISYFNVESASDQREDLFDTDFPGERVVKSVKLYSKPFTYFSGSFAGMKYYRFGYGYFNNPSQNSYSYKRLRLDTLQEERIYTTSPMIPPHLFEYNNSPIPAYDASGIDHWGFYNGSINSTLIPSVNVDGVILPFGGGGNREPNFDASSCAILHKIIYPTGGYSTFEYELNEAIDGPINVSNPLVRQVGGIRLKQMIDYSFDNLKAIVKNYEYLLDNGKSAGRAFFPGYISHSTFTNYVLLALGSSTSEDFVTQYTTISASAVGGLGSFQGSHIGYSQVMEYQTDLANNEPLGKTVYNYNIESFDGNDDLLANGDLISQKVYDNGNKLLYEETNTYSYFNNGPGIVAYKVQANAIQDNKSILCQYDVNGSTIYEWKLITSLTPLCTSTRFYKSKLQYTGSVIRAEGKNLTQQTEKRYDQLSNAYISSTKKFFYDNTAHNLPNRIEQNTTSNEVVITEKRYPLDYSLPSTGTFDEPTQGIKNLQAKNIIASEIESFQYRQNADGSNKRVINGMLTTYEPFIPYPKNIYRLEIDQPIVGFQASSSNGTLLYNMNYKLVGTFAYDGNKNLTEQSKAQDIKTAYVWDAESLLPTAEVTDASISSIAYTSFENNGFGNWNNISSLSANRVFLTNGSISGIYAYNLTGNNITKSGLPVNRQHIVSYWSNNGTANITTNIGNTTPVTGPSRLGFTYYEHLLPANSSSITISGNVTIDELRLYPKGSLMTSQTYYRATGMLWATNQPNNMINYFNFDGYLRLSSISNENRNYIKTFNYNYAKGAALSPSSQTLFFNTKAERTLSRTNCTNGGEGIYTYIVPYGKYVSSLNQEDADSKALIDLNTNAQNQVNQYAECRYYNEETSSNTFYRNNCYASNFGPPSPSMGVIYTVPARKYFTLTSIADANALADAEIAATVQAYANQYGNCTCTQANSKYMSETGPCEISTTKILLGVLQISANQYQCSYAYLFSDNSLGQIIYEMHTTACIPE